MRKFAFAFTLILCAFAMSACVHIAYGPSDNIADAEYVKAVQAAVGSKETIGFMDKGYFLANTPRPGPAQTWGTFGTLVVTDKSLYFLHWNRNAKTFDIIRKLPVGDIIDSEYISSIFGPGEYISVEDKDHRFDLFSCFEMYSSASAARMVDRNHELLDYISAVRNAK